MNTRDGSDTHGLSVGDPMPDGWLNDDPPCTAEDAIGYLCTATEGHDGPHVATGADLVLAVWS